MFERNRLPMISDGLSHWSDIFLWRHHHYEAIVSAYDAQHDQVLVIVFRAYIFVIFTNFQV